MHVNSVNIRDISIKCGRCQSYQTLCGFEPAGEWNVYTYECENQVCDPEVTRKVEDLIASTPALRSIL